MRMSTTISISDFKIFRKDNYYYVDKTLLIEELFTKGDQVILLPRPRRFGKTLNLSMLKYYFDIREDNKNLFKGLKIENNEIFEKYLNKYPVISLTFKDVKGLTWDEDYMKLKNEIRREYREHKYLLNSYKLEERDKNYFNKVLDEGNIDYSVSILELSRLLYEHHNKEVVILLDEYDTPVNKLLDDDHYKHIISFLRNMIGSTFKGNNYLFKGIITGILRIAKESIFSGANNILVQTILSNDFSDKFGFIDSEVIEILKYYGLEDKIEKIREWYNGYKFGNDIIYNPYSIISYIQNSENELKGYWVNTGAENLLIKNL